MALHITHRDVEMANLYARDSISRLKGVGQRGGAADRAVTGLAKAFEVTLGAGLVGVLSGKFGSADLHVGGKSIPMDLLGGLAGLGVSLFMENEAASEHLSNFSVGVLAGFSTKYGVGVGRAWAEKKPGGSALPAVAGVMNMLGGRTQAPAARPMTKEELAKMAESIR
jgi:hypothetical protein